MTSVATTEFVVFGVMVAASGLLAVYSRLSAPTAASSKKGFSFATGTVSSGAVLMSIARTGLGIRAIVGFPAELYYHGVGMWETLIGVLFAYLVVDVVFMPVYFAMPTTSIYEFLELRFQSGLLRRLTSCLYIVRTCLMLGVTTLTPCVAIQAVLGVPLWATIIAVGTLGILFTTFGGMRGVILNDVLQGVALFFCTLAILYRGTTQLPEGFVGAFKTASANGRLDFFNFDPDPTLRVSTLSAVLGQVFIATSAFGCQQSFAQRYRSLPDRKSVQRVLLMAIPVVCFLESVTWVSGVVIYALYAACDPLSAGLIKSIDGLVPFFVQKEFSAVPGLLGFFFGAVFNGAFGITVAMLNSVATVTWEDFLSNIKCVRELTEIKQLWVIRSIGILYAIVIMLVAIALSSLPGLVESSFLISSTFSGPLLGVFLLALLFPSANKHGAIAGLVVSLGSAVSLSAGRLVVSRGKTTLLPLSVEGCPAANNGTSDLDILKKYDFGLAPKAPLDWTYLFSISFMYYAMMGCVICLITGVIVSYLTVEEDFCYPASLVHPWARKISDLLPGKPRKYLSDSEIKKHLNSSSRRSVRTISITVSADEHEFITHF
ncbi:sodium-coupled monocarboxylate transporter 2-like [Neocloeon triangulifer]|uniref:sodium-coupled monocarboxylate transporter 2-like n=1 Tax=Neocloeon triangulifer TaxID=2078957 RepID=UPI00286F8137|nr:sodium-coupled monocarboxylate transporter 2-like [Neocloeon triangulifer]XP_059470686.1 sodium-coupled monocarboxylate transporter 2-like [Neocloeon triangulifer]